MKRVPYETMVSEFARVLEKHGFTPADARDAAVIFAQNSLAGVFSHGLNRFPRVVSYLEKGEIDPGARATCEMTFGSLERWDGHRGFGPLNAKRAMDRACELAKQNGVGVVALGNNNHWMRGGTYGWLAADQGCIGICWSNTMPNMPAWGGKDRKIGNNPLILAVPRSNGEHAMIDCAVSQFSYGKIEDCRLRGVQLPVPRIEAISVSGIVSPRRRAASCQPSRPMRSVSNISPSISNSAPCSMVTSPVRTARLLQ